MLGRQRAPGRIVDERLPLRGVQRGHLVGLPGTEVAEGGAQGLLLERPHGVPVDRVEPVELASAVGEGVDLGARRLGEAVGAGQVAQVDVDGVEEATRGRQVGRGLHRRDGLGGVQRVDEDEVRVVLAGGPLPEGAEVTEVTDALAAGSPYLVQLRQQPGPRLLLHDGGQLQTLGHGDEHGPLAPFGQRSGLDLRDDLVPPQGQVARDLEGGLAHHRAVDVVRLDDVLELLQVTAVPPFELDVDGHRAAVRHVHEEAKGVALTLDDGRGQRAAPRRGPDPLEGGVHGGLVGDVLAHGREHGPQRGLRHLTVLAAPVPPVGVDALGGGEGAQVRRVGHGATLAQAHGCCPPGSRG